ncbi:hypothetical protein MTO96_051417 [Rhipicephalus appendiculatus]
MASGKNDANGAESESSAGPDGAHRVCRICFQGANEERGQLVAPCSCKGSIGLTHKSCLERWLRQRHTDQCNVCLARFNIRKTPAPLCKFFRVPEHRMDVMRMAVNLLSCIGDILVLGLAWTYAVKILGSQGWFAYTVIVLVLLFQSLFWLTVEGIRAWCDFYCLSHKRGKEIGESLPLLTATSSATHIEDGDNPDDYKTQRNTL